MTPKAKPLTEDQILKIETRAKEYLPHYQDELSRGVLSDMLEFLRTRDGSVFIDRVENIGLKFCEPSDIWEKVSGIVFVYDNDNS